MGDYLIGAGIGIAFIILIINLPAIIWFIKGDG